MEEARTDRSDKRLDHLKLSVDDGFREVQGSNTRLDGRIDRLQQTMIIVAVAMCAMMFSGSGR